MKDEGVVCPKCGNPRLPVIYIRRRGKANVRVRICRPCKKRIRCREFADGSAPQERVKSSA